MRIFASVTLAILLLGLVPAVAAAEEPFPYFRRTGEEFTPGQHAQVEGGQLSSTPKVGILLEADRNEANPGDEVRYWIRVTNLYDKNLKPWQVAFFFERNAMAIIDAGGATGGGDHLKWTVPASGPGQQHVFSVRVRLKTHLRPGESVRTYASMIWDGQISPACSKHDLLIIARPPVTGRGDGTRPVEDLKAFLRPVSAAKSGSALPALFWGSIALVGAGATAGRSFLAKGTEE